MNENARCTEPPSQSNARGAQNIPQRAAASYTGSPVVAAYDPETGKLTWGSSSKNGSAGLESSGSVAPPTLGEESWKWLFLQPLTTGQE